MNYAAVRFGFAWWIADTRQPYGAIGNKNPDSGRIRTDIRWLRFHDYP